MTRLRILAVAMNFVAITGCDQHAGQAMLQVSPDHPPVPRIAEFEDSAFCRKYQCRLVDPIYVVGVDGKVERCHYTYRLAGNDLMNIDFSLSANGERKEPYIAVYWRPVKPVETRVRRRARRRTQ